MFSVCTLHAFIQQFTHSDIPKVREVGGGKHFENLCYYANIFDCGKQ